MGEGRSKAPALHKEEQFHDQWASKIHPEDIDVNVRFEGVTAPENRWIMEQLGDVSGKCILDIGCGAGEASVYLASRGAACVACDLSTGMLGTARRLAASNEQTVQVNACTATTLPYKDNSFDIVYAANVLHHAGPEATLREMHRVLKPGGYAATWDPLRHNPLIGVYRLIARDVRSDDERPLSIGVTRQARELFEDVRFETFWIATLWIFVSFFLFERVSPNKERYWVKIYTDEAKLRGLHRRLAKVDTLLKKVFPPIRRYAWNLAMVMRKHGEVDTTKD